MPWPLGHFGARGFALLWSGRDLNAFRTIVSALDRAGIGFEKTRVRGYEALPPSLYPAALFSKPVFRIRVASHDRFRARLILQEVIGSAPPA